MNSNSSFFIYLTVLSFALIGGVYKISQRDFATKTLVALLCITLLSELTAHWAAIKFRNNMFVYHFFSPIQLIFLGVYFDNVISRLKRIQFAKVVCAIATIAAVVNTVFFQSLKILNSNFLLLEGLIIMALALYTFQLILSDERINIYSYGHFWMIVIFIFFWSITYTWWALYTVLQEKERYVLSHISRVLWAVNIITYAAIGFVLIYFSGNGSKKQLAHE